MGSSREWWVKGAKTEYGSHLWLLDRVFATYSPQTVLETGSGLYSTNYFLKSGAELVSLENDRKWLRRPGPDHDIVHVDGPMVEALPELDEFDLIFIDDDPPDDRQRTIQTVIDRTPTGLVVVHDADYQVFADTIRARCREWGKHWHIDEDHVPHTALIWASREQEELWHDASA